MTIEAAVSVLRVQPGDRLCVFVNPDCATVNMQGVDQIREGLMCRIPGIADVLVFQGFERLTVLRDGETVEAEPAPSVVVDEPLTVEAHP